MQKIIFSHLRAAVLFAVMGLFILPASLSGQTIIRQGSWTKVWFAASGQWQIVKNGHKLQLSLSKDFATTNGPDLYILLSPYKVSKLTDSNATQGAFKVAPLKRKGYWGKIKGPFIFELPADLDLTKYQSIAIHCVKYAELWVVSPLN